MAQLHELLAAEKTPTGAWNSLLEETHKKFKTPATYYDGYSKKLQMLEDTPANKVLEAQALEEKPVVTTVYETLEWVFGIYARAEDLQFQKNSTNARATATVMWEGAPFLENLSVDELLGLEARLTKIRGLFMDIPTLDASKHWKRNPDISPHIWETMYPEENTKTEKTIVPVITVAATKEHPAQVQIVPKDVVVGQITKISRSGAATAAQKADAIKRVDDLLIEVKQARMRANQTEVVPGAIGQVLVDFLLEPFEPSE